MTVSCLVNFYRNVRHKKLKKLLLRCPTGICRKLFLDWREKKVEKDTS